MPTVDQSDMRGLVTARFLKDTGTLIMPLMPEVLSVPHEVV
jgi:hypothetical protein